MFFVAPFLYKNYIMKNITKYFFRGLYLLTPIGLTLYILYWIFIKIDGMFNISIPGLGFLITIAVVFIIGFIASNYLAKELLETIEKLFRRLPFVKLLYNSIKDLMDAFVGTKRKFDKPVLVIVTPGHGRALGFITRESMNELNKPGDVAVYFPQSYNVAGMVLLYPKENVEPISVNSADLMAFIVSGGVSGLHDYGKEAKLTV
jgi:uncharacterized membrane protein